VYRDFVLAHPMPFLKAVWSFNQFFRNGAYLPEHMQAPDLSRHAELEHLGWIIVPAGVAYRVLAISSFWLLLAGWVYLVLRKYLPAVRTLDTRLRLFEDRGAAARSHALAPDRIAVPAFIILSLPAILLTAIFSSQVGGENFRYFYQITPYLFVVGMLFIDEILRRLGIGSPRFGERS
jgi:hypothetical protein